MREVDTLGIASSFKIKYPPPTTTKHAQTKQLADREGQVGLYIMENRLAVIPGSTGVTVGIVTTLEPAPNSRHVHGHIGYRDLLKKFGTDETEDSVARGTCVPRIAFPYVHQPTHPPTTPPQRDQAWHRCKR